VVRASSGFAWRLWFLQASWNREGMQSIGRVVCALPAARRRGLCGTDLARWMRPRLSFFNTNPYLAGLLLGAVLRLESEGNETVAGKLEAALSRSLGAIGDGLMWEGLRPIWAFLALVLAFRWGPPAILAGWLLFGFGQLALRQWCWVEGWRRGRHVVELVGHPRVQTWMEGARSVAPAAAGLAVGVAYMAHAAPATTIQGLAWVAAALGCGALAAWRRWSLEWLLPAAVGVGWLVLRLGPGA